MLNCLNIKSSLSFYYPLKLYYLCLRFLKMGSSPKRVEYIIKDVNLSPCPLGPLDHYSYYLRQQLWVINFAITLFNGYCFSIYWNIIFAIIKLHKMFLDIGGTYCIVMLLSSEKLLLNSTGFHNIVLKFNTAMMHVTDIKKAQLYNFTY